MSFYGNTVKKIIFHIQVKKKTILKGFKLIQIVNEIIRRAKLNAENN